MTANTESLRWLSLEGDGAGAALAIRRGIVSALAAVMMFVGGCTTLPPGMDAPKDASTALEHPESTALGKRFEAQAKEHPGLSGLSSAGRWNQRVHAAARRSPPGPSGRSTSNISCCSRTTPGSSCCRRCSRPPTAACACAFCSMTRRPSTRARRFARLPRTRTSRSASSTRSWCGASCPLFRWAEFVVGGRRLNYRMHNKLFIGDNAIAVTGGRNVGDAVLPGEHADSSSAISTSSSSVPWCDELSRSFDLYWNDKLAIPVETLPLGKPSAADLETEPRRRSPRTRTKMADFRLYALAAEARFLAEALSGKPPLVLGEGGARLRHAGQGAGRTRRPAGQPDVAARCRSGRAHAARPHPRLAVPRPRRERDGADTPAARARRARSDPDEFAGVDRHADRARRLHALPRAAARSRLRALRGPAGARPARDRATVSSNPAPRASSGFTRRCSSSTISAPSSAR